MEGNEKTVRSVVLYVLAQKYAARLEPLLLLGPFMEEPLHVTLQGVTNHPDDITVDTFRTVTLATLKPFGLEGLALKVLKRGALPLGGGKVVFDCPITPLLQPITWLEPDRVKRIRGVAFTSKVSTQFGARMLGSISEV